MLEKDLLQNMQENFSEIFKKKENTVILSNTSENIKLDESLNERFYYTDPHVMPIINQKLK